MKVLFIGTDRKIFEEGSAVRARQIEYGKLFDEVHIVVFSLVGHGLKEVVQIAGNVFVHPTNSRNRFFYILDALRISKKIIKDSRLKIQDSVISTQDPFETGIVGVILKLRYTLPLHIQIHTDFVNRFFVLHSVLNMIRFPLGLFVLSFADSARVVSEKIEISIHSLVQTVSVLPIYTSVDTHGDYVEKLHITPIKILTVSRLEKEKDLKTALYAFKHLLKSGIKASFTIVGDGGERRSLETLCVDLKIQDKVIFAGWQNNLTAYYEEADIYISTSLYEGYGMSTVEAGSYAIPLVLSDTGLARSVFRDDIEAYICKQKCVTDFGSALVRLASHAERRVVMGKSAREAVRTHLISYEEYMRRFKESIQDAYNFFNIEHSIFKRNILVRYFLAGITGASTQIGLLYVFTDILHVWYIYSSIIAFSVAVCLGFLLHKFWTFNDNKVGATQNQFMRYGGVALLGLCINSTAMYILVDICALWYIVAQIITGFFIMFFNFLMYKFFIFKK